MYTLHAERQGFAVSDVTGIIFYVADNRNLAITLNVGSTSQTVNADGNALMLSATDRVLSTVINRALIENTQGILVSGLAGNGQGTVLDIGMIVFAGGIS